MKSRRFVLVIMDSTGRWVRRVGVARRRIEVAAALLALGLVMAITLTVDGLVRRGPAAESRELRQENEQLTALLADLEGQLPALRRGSLRAQVSFDQLWAKSHLGVEPTLLAVGPVEGSDERGTGAFGSGNRFASAVSGELLAAEPIALPLEVGRIGEDQTRVQYQLSQLLEYFSDADRILQNTPSVRPVRQTWITSSFGRRRDPILKTVLMHKGLDLGGRTGMEILAPADAVVIYAGRRGGYGLTVVLHHGFGLQTHFAHLSAFEVRVGARVQRGQVIALMGSTGKSTGPHLHYEVRRNGRPLDPAHFILD